MALPPWLPLALRVWIIGACAYMMACSVLSIMGTRASRRSTRSSLGLYVLLFAILIVAYESTRFCSESTPAEVIERVYKRNFGFMLKAQTRGMFLIFVGFMVLGSGRTPERNTGTRLRDRYDNDGHRLHLPDLQGPGPVHGQTRTKAPGAVRAA